MADYSRLQNGSDVRGVALALREGETVDLTPQAAGEIVRAFVRWLSERTGKAPAALSVAGGRDPRLSGQALLAAAGEGVRAEGAAWGDCGLASTPAMFMATILPGLEYDGAVMVTASHLPADRNGLKFFTREGGLESSEIREILARAGSLPPAGEASGETAHPPLMERYAAHLREVIRRGVGEGEKPLAGFRIAVDAGNGAGGFFASQVLEPLGADVSASQFLEPDGSFPNHIPNPEDKTAMAAIREAVLRGGCDLGFIFDTDVDRAGAVGPGGREIGRNRLIGLLGAIVAREAPGSTVVTDSVTSSQLTDFLEGKLGLRHRRFRRGYKNVIDEGIRLNREGTPCLLAIETSGHAAMRENWFLDDGAYAAVKILIQAALLRREGRTVEDLLRELREPREAAEYRIPIRGEDFAARGKEVLASLAEYAASRPGWEPARENFEGVRVSVPEWEGWFLLRLSLHDPILPLNIESDREGGAAAILAQLRPFLSRCGGLDLASLPG